VARLSGFYSCRLCRSDPFDACPQRRVFLSGRGVAQPFRQQASAPAYARHGGAGSTKWLERCGIRYDRQHHFRKQLCSSGLSALSTEESVGVATNAVLVQIDATIEIVICVQKKSRRAEIASSRDSSKPGGRLATGLFLFWDAPQRGEDFLPSSRSQQSHHAAQQYACRKTFTCGLYFVRRRC
jgi:hypothetical protein